MTGIQFRTRWGCSYCFRTLNPLDLQANLRTFVTCENCHTCYHESCWQGTVCDNCGHDKKQVTTITQPPILQVETKKHAIAIKPSTIFCIEGEHAYEIESSTYVVSRYSQFLTNIAKAIAVGTVFVIIASLVAPYVYSLYARGEYSAETIQQLLFETPFPMSLFRISALSAVIWAIILFVPDRTGHARWFTRLLAGIVTTIMLDIVQLNLRWASLSRPIELWQIYSPVIITQAITALTLIVLVPIFHTLINLKYPPPLCLTEWFSELLGQLRLILVTLFLAVTLISAVTLQLLPTVFSSKYTTSLVVLLVAFGVAALVYRAPKHRNLQSTQEFIRFLLIVICSVIVWWIYRQGLIPRDMQLILLFTTGATTVLTAPLQRLLS